MKTVDEYEEWEDIGDLAQALSQLFLHKDLPPLLEFSADPHIDLLEEQLLLLDKLRIQEPESPSRKGHFSGGHLLLAVAAHVLLFNQALTTIQVLHGQSLIYSVTLMSPVSLPALSMSFSSFGQIFDERQVSVSPSPELSIHCFVLTIQDEVAKKKNVHFPSSGCNFS